MFATRLRVAGLESETGRLRIAYPRLGALSRLCGPRPVRRREFGYGPMLYQHMAERQRPREITIPGNPVVPGNLI